MQKDKLNPQKPGISQPRPHPKQGQQPSEPPSKEPGTAQPRSDDDDKARQVPIEGE